MFDILCSLPLTSELFTQSLNPVEPLLAVGLATGHVETFRLPTSANDNSTSAKNGDDEEDDDDDDDDNTSQKRRSSLSSNSSPTPLIASAWRTRRHKGSCRALAYSAVDGAFLFSGGTDGLIKCADSATGRVVAKVAIPLPGSYGTRVGKPAAAGGGAGAADLDAPSVLHALTPTTFLLGTDAGSIYLYDTRTAGKSQQAPAVGAAILSARPDVRCRPHLDYVSAICAAPPGEASTSGLPRAFFSTGAASVALTDIRKGVVAASADAAEPLTGCAVSAPAGRLVVSDASGALASWDRSQGATAHWADGIGRARVDVARAVTSPEGDRLPVPGDEAGGAAIDVLCAVPGGSAASRALGDDDAVVLGWDSGRVEVVALKGKGRGASAGGRPATRAQVVADFPPDTEREGVVGVGFDAAGRLVVGAGAKVTIYAHVAQEAVDWRGDGAGDDDDSDDDGSRDGGDRTMGNGSAAAAAGGKRTAREDSGEEAGNGSSEEEEEERQRSKPKKKKRKGKAQKNHPSFNFAGID